MGIERAEKKLELEFSFPQLKRNSPTLSAMDEQGSGKKVTEKFVVDELAKPKLEILI